MAGLQEIEKAVAAIRAGKPAPLYLFYGDQDFLVRQAFDRVCEALVPEGLRAFNFEQMDGSKAEVGEILDALQTVPMMPGAKVLALPDFRFLLSKNQAGEIFSKAREKWEQGDLHGSLRLLAKVLVLADTDWDSAQGLTAADLKRALGLDELDESKPDWLAKALAQGKASAVALPKGGDESQEFLAGLERIYADGASTGQHLVLAAPSADGRKKLFKFLEGRGLVLDFKSADKAGPAGQAAGTFLHNMLQQKGLRLDAALAQRMVLAYGHDLGFLAKELDKMEAFAHPRKALQASDLEAVGSPRPEEDVFELLGALGRKDISKALPLLAGQLKTQPPQAIFGMLAKEVRNLFLARCLVEEGLVPAKLPEYPLFRSGLHPKLCKALPGALGEAFKRTHAFVSYQALSRCRRFSLEDLKKALAFVLEADVQMKTSAKNPADLLEELCLRLCGVQEEVVA